MALITTIDEIKAAFSSIDKDYKIASLRSFISDAENNILIPWIGRAVYDVIADAYTPGPIAGKKKQLHEYLQKAAVNLALMLSADSGSFRISDAGFYVIVTDNNKPVSDRKMLEFKHGRREAGYLAMEQAIEFLEANIDEADFAAYKDSPEHELHRAYFINSAIEFTRYFKKVNNSAYLFWQCLDALDFSERKYIKPLLGNSYFDALKAKILANSLSDAEKSLLKKINKALANYTMAKAIIDLQLEFDGTNLVVKSKPTTGNYDNAGNVAPASREQLGSLAYSATITGESELRELEEYLVEHAQQLPGYTPPATTEDFNINDPNSPTFFV